MTATLVRSRQPLSVLSITDSHNNNAMSMSVRAGKRQAAATVYDEQDGDFLFTRGSKRAKTITSTKQPSPPPPALPPPAAQPDDFDDFQPVRTGAAKKAGRPPKKAAVASTKRTVAASPEPEPEPESEPKPAKRQTRQQTVLATPQPAQTTTRSTRMRGAAAAAAATAAAAAETAPVPASAARAAGSTRRGGKRKSAGGVPAPEPTIVAPPETIEEEEEPEEEVQPRGKRGRKGAAAGAQEREAQAPAKAQQQRKSKRGINGTREEEPEPPQEEEGGEPMDEDERIPATQEVPVQPSRGRTRTAPTPAKPTTTTTTTTTLPTNTPRPAGRPGPTTQSQTIPLPFSDTPIMERNKEMRRKKDGAGGAGNSRRSSLGMRGRRASSLIESGHNALPHREVDPAEFYKYIAADGLSEPRRMKQLLIWCGERALSEKPRGKVGIGGSAVLGARAIQDQLLKDFGARSEFSDWFSREEEPKRPVVLQPNPKNIQFDEKIAELEAKIERLKAEKRAWQAITKPFPIADPLYPPTIIPPTPSEDQPQEQQRPPPPLKPPLPDTSLLSPSEQTILSSLTSTSDVSRRQVRARLQNVQSQLEFAVDLLADGVHKLDMRVQSAGREADAVLALAAKRLREREEREKRAVGTVGVGVWEVLRSLGRLCCQDGGT